jgi:CheY-like chemotaxis protein
MEEKRTAILVAEDEPSARLGLRSLLGDEGFEVQVAVDGVDALAKLEGFRPDVLLIDVKMPRLDGIGFFRQARKRLPLIPAIFMTGLSDKELVASGLMGEPGVSFIQKPVDLDELLPLIASRP